MAVLARIDRHPVTVAGEAHTGWLPPNAAEPLPPAAGRVELDLTIEDDGDGYVLAHRSADGAVRGDTWHPTADAARDAAWRDFGVPPDAWRAGDGDRESHGDARHP